jgi:cob(I)alamin adenosyltransferase
MKIYTKTGDQGETSLFGGERVKKSHPRVQAYGTLDEANSTIGVAISFIMDAPDADASGTRQQLVEQLTRVQSELFQVGGELASPTPPAYLVLINETEIQRLESEIDQMEKSLAPLVNFILPGGKPGGAALHLARTISRRAERECVELASTEAIRPEVIRYLNRLSDYLFVAARFMNFIQKTSEQPWRSRSSK